MKWRREEARQTSARSRSACRRRLPDSQRSLSLHDVHSRETVGNYPPGMTTSVWDVLRASERAIEAGIPTRRTPDDKEFHFQRWFAARIEDAGFGTVDAGRNTYPDFPIDDINEAYEVKGITQGSRENDFDCNSALPSGEHNGDDVMYAFGRYQKVRDGGENPRVLDIAIVHGALLNAGGDYVAANKSMRVVGSYGDVLLRDRKMYVAYTPFRLLTNMKNHCTLVLPSGWPGVPADAHRIGEFIRTEAEEILVGYEADLRANTLTGRSTNPNAGTSPSVRSLDLRSFPSRGDRGVAMSRYTSVGMFSGAGGLDLGFEQAGFEHLAAMDHDPWAIRTLMKNRPGWNVDEADARDWAWDDEVDVLVAGPPCQGYSLGGNRQATDERNLLYREVLRVARDIRPRVVVIENVLNLRTLAHPETGRPFDQQIASDLEGITLEGYEVFYDIFRMAGFGVPQTRRRFVFVAFRDGAPRGYTLPKPNGAESIRPWLYDLGQGEHVDLPNHRPEWGFRSTVHV